MKRIYLIVGLILTFGIEVMANEGTTKGFYAKPGAPVDLTYCSEPIENAQSCSANPSNKIANTKSGDVNITLETTIESGKMSVDIEFDKNITNLSNTPSKLLFDVTKDKKRFPINIKIDGKVDGLYYIRFFITIQEDLEKRVRSLAVPVYIGDYNASRQKEAYPAPMMLKSSNKQIENVTVFKAKENFEAIKKVDINSSLETNSSVN